VNLGGGLAPHLGGNMAVLDWIRKRWSALLILVCAVVMNVYASPYRFTAQGALDSDKDSTVRAVFEFGGGQAFVFRQGDNHWLRLSCRVGPLWKACGTVHLLQPFASLSPLGASMLMSGNDGSAGHRRVFAGLVEDDRVRVASAAGDDLPLAPHGYFMYVWRTDDPHGYLPAKALDKDGRVLYEIVPNENDWPIWREVSQP